MIAKCKAGSLLVTKTGSFGRGNYCDSYPHAAGKHYIECLAILLEDVDFEDCTDEAYVKSGMIEWVHVVMPDGVREKWQRNLFFLVSATE